MLWYIQILVNAKFKKILINHIWKIVNIYYKTRLVSIFQHHKPYHPSFPWKCHLKYSRGKTCANRREMSLCGSLHFIFAYCDIISNWVKAGQILWQPKSFLYSAEHQPANSVALQIQSTRFTEPTNTAQKVFR